MRILHQIVALFRALVRSRRIDADLADDMRFHIDASQEQSRDDRPGAGIRGMFRDLRFGARLLRKSPVFAITAIAIVALGIGAATAIFSVVFGVMLRPLPYREPEQLVSIW